ncbi:type 2 lanthipeptide synthetase LanM family protein [Alloactinosynnema sp. L-07]|uniref:type 2 lanthipeptide synthetase LanM family protein n=1 Tax=Alloactinosynnema sp. L-07 TaxID=1653480 RepID=UPI0006B4F9AD|nr:type 2 lanthipeptide synthetase LanM family protein [Alloactinosynnema sp. L-07]
MATLAAGGGRRWLDAYLPPGWWAPGLALHERIRTPVTPGDGPSDPRLDAWRAVHGPDGAARFAARLAEQGLDEQRLAWLLAEPPSALAARVPRPAWADTVERALIAAVDEPVDVPEAWRDAFAVVLRPFVADAGDRLTTALVGMVGIDRLAVVLDARAHLSRRLVGIATRILVRELGARRAAGVLTGVTSSDRFADFVRQLARPVELAAALGRYPVLARLIAQACDAAVTACAELLDRFVRDRADIVRDLLGGVDPGLVVGVDLGQGDPHRGGRAVAVLRFDDGRRVVYRPRDIEAHLRFGAMIDWMNRLAPGLGLRAVAAIARSGYGWLEFIDRAPLPDAAGADRFYRKLGALLAIVHVVHAGDLHYQNLIAAGDTPVLVDLETLFHPRLAAPRAAGDDPAADALADSVYRTSLLPVMVVGDHGAVDCSGLGGDAGPLEPDSVLDWADPATDLMRPVLWPRPFRPAGNRPRLDGREIEPGDHESALLNGFRLGYDALVRHRDDFAVLLRACVDTEVRVVARPTRGYAALLAEATDPEVLADGLDRDRMFEVLWTSAAADPVRWRLCPAETADLWAGDVPLFAGRPGGTDLWTSTGARGPRLLDRAGLAVAMGKLAALGEIDRRDQEWIIAATLATRRPARPHRAPRPMPGSIAGTSAPAERLLVAACAVGDQIVARGIADGGAVSWIGLELVDERQWLVLPMGVGLANGTLGVALFLAQLAELSGIDRYTDVAGRTLRGTAALIERFADAPESAPAVGSGGLHGFGGIAYALARIARLLDDGDLRRLAATSVDLAAAAADGAPGWATGGAGCLAAMGAVHAELDLPAAGTLARSCADGLVQLVADPGDDPPSGFADGVAGVAWALSRYAESVAEPGYAEAARRAAALVAEDPGQPPGWCAGTAGLLLGRSCAADGGGPRMADQVRDLAWRPVLSDLSLCCGELGVIDTVTALTARVPGVADTRRRSAGLVLDAITRHGARCGTPGQVPTPGLLNGLAGIGYGLLRLGFANRVPSALLLESIQHDAN